MLVLRRKVDERIMVNDDIAITVVEIRADKVKIGIDAPPDVIVWRQEIYDAIRQETREATSATVGPESGGEERQEATPGRGC